MRKIIVLIALAGLISNRGMGGEENCCSSSNQEMIKRLWEGIDENKLPPRNDWTGIQIGFFPGFPACTKSSNVNGLKLGLPMSSGRGRVWGLELSLFSSSTDLVRGAQIALLANVAKLLDGLQAGLVNVATVTANGAQIGLVNYSEGLGWQIGLVNILPDSSLPFLPLLNIHLDPHEKVYIQKFPDNVRRGQAGCKWADEKRN